MTLTVPLVVVLGIAVFIAWRYTGLRVWHLVVTALFGFLVATTNAAPEIRKIVAAIVQMLDHR